MASVQDIDAAVALAAEEVIERRLNFWSAVGELRKLLDGCSVTFAHSNLVAELKKRGHADLVRGLPP